MDPLPPVVRPSTPPPFRDEEGSPLPPLQERDHHHRHHHHHHHHHKHTLGVEDLEPRRNSAIFRSILSSGFSVESRLNEEKAVELETRLRTLVSAFSTRAKQTKAEIKRPPTPSTEESDSDASTIPESAGGGAVNQLQLLAPDSLQTSRKTSYAERSCIQRCCYPLKKICNVLTFNYILDPQGRVYVGWLALVSILFLYNAWSLPLRTVFPYQSEENVELWFQLDCIADSIYLLDILLFKSHYKFIRDGFWVKTPKETWKAYICSRAFCIDLGALFPLDIIFAYYYVNMPWLRIPRLLKIFTFWEFFRRLDNVLASPHAARIARTILYMLYMIHLNGAAYYALSRWEGINATQWTYDGDGNAYIRCFYFATKTATSIGKNPKPGNEIEYIFMTVAWLSGVFIFAVLIGQVRDIVATATKALTDYQVVTGSAINYLNRFDVPDHLQDRVKLWLTYTWEQQKTLDESKILAYLPQKMQGDLALHVHIETLSKVKLFHNCEPAFFRDLVLRLRSIIFLPGEYVCRKGEVGKEMYIVRSGFVTVLGGASGTQILVTLGAGSAFGEIALLAIGGMTKRTADVRSAGFSNLFVLSKADLNQAIKDYPLAQAILRRKAKKLIKASIKKQKEERLKNRSELSTTGSDSRGDGDDDGLDDDKIIIKDKKRTPTPKFLSAVLKAIDPKSKAARLLKYGSKADLSDIAHHDDMTKGTGPHPPLSRNVSTDDHLSRTASFSFMSDSSEDQIYPSLPYESMTTEAIEDVWRDDGSDDVFLRRKDSLPEYNMSIMTSSVLKASDNQVRRIAALLPPAVDTDSLSLHLATHEPTDIVVTPRAHLEEAAEAGTSGSGTRVQPISDRYRQFRRQLSIRGDDVEEEDDDNYDVLTLNPDAERLGIEDEESLHDTNI